MRYKYSIKIVFKSGQILCSLLNKVEDPLDQPEEAVQCDEIAHSCGKSIYVSETKRRLETRINKGTQGCTHEAFHQQVSHHGAHSDPGSSHPLEQDKRAMLCSQMY